MRPLNTGFLTSIIAVMIGFLPLLFLVELGVSNLAFAFIGYGVILAVIAGLVLLFKKTAAKTSKYSENNSAECLSEHVGDAVLRYNQQGEIIFISNSAKKLFNCQTYELTGSGLIDRTHILDRVLYMSAISQAIHNNQKTKISIRMRSDNIEPNRAIANYIWVELSLSPISKENGASELVALLQNVTEQKQLQEEIISSKKQAELANDEKSHFLAMVGHELRTPLNAIVGFSEMMENGIGGKLVPKHQEYAELISQSGHHLVGVVNSLLDMSRIEAGKFELTINDFDPSALISPSLHMVETAAKEKNITIKIKKDDNFQQVKADERACRQIIINLLSNAIKFSDVGQEVVLSLSLRGHSLRIAVQDNGIGMSAEHIKKLGEPFLQADKGANRNYEGTGLGISIVKGLVALHHGSFSVQSKLNVGSNISILLPIKGIQNQVEKNQIEPAQLEQGKIGTETRDEKIISISSNKQQAKRFKQYLLDEEIQNKRAAQ